MYFRTKVQYEYAEIGKGAGPGGTWYRRKLLLALADNVWEWQKK